MINLSKTIKTYILLLFYLFSLSFIISCRVVKKQKKVLHVYCDNFPALIVDTIPLDTIQFKKYIKRELKRAKNDSIDFIIECPNNIVLEEVLSTESIIEKQINSYSRKRISILVYNKCLSEFTLPWNKKIKQSADITVNIDSIGMLSINNKPVDIHSLCEQYRGQNITIKIIADTRLSVEKFGEILNVFEREKFKVFLGN